MNCACATYKGQFRNLKVLMYNFVYKTSTYVVGKKANTASLSIPKIFLFHATIQTNVDQPFIRSAIRLFDPFKFMFDTLARTRQLQISTFS